MRRPWREFGLVGGFFGWNVWNVSAFIWSLRDPPLKVIGAVELHPPFFLLVACISIPVTVAISGVLFWEHIRGAFPKNQFHALVDELHEAGQVVSFRGPHMTLREVREVLTIARKLNRLGIKTPPLDEDYRIWKARLTYMTSLAETKDLKEARSRRP